jgi:hypothetical protein
VHVGRQGRRHGRRARGLLHRQDPVGLGSSDGLRARLAVAVPEVCRQRALLSSGQRAHRSHGGLAGQRPLAVRRGGWQPCRGRPARSVGPAACPGHRAGHHVAHTHRLARIRTRAAGPDPAHPLPAPQECLALDRQTWCDDALAWARTPVKGVVSCLRGVLAHDGIGEAADLVDLSDIIEQQIAPSGGASTLPAHCGRPRRGNWPTGETWRPSPCGRLLPPVPHRPGPLRRRPRPQNLLRPRRPVLLLRRDRPHPYPARPEQATTRPDTSHPLSRTSS